MCVERMNITQTKVRTHSQRLVDKKARHDILFRRSFSVGLELRIPFGTKPESRKPWNAHNGRRETLVGDKKQIQDTHD